MATYTKRLLSGATDGRQIKVSATSSLGAPIIHAAVSGTADLDEIWLWVHNSNTASGKITVQWGSNTSPDDEIEINTAGSEGGYILAVPGLLLNNSASIRAFAGSANVFMVNGYVNRITA